MASNEDETANRSLKYGRTAKLVTGAIVAVSIGLAIPLYFARPKGLPQNVPVPLRQAASPASLLSRSSKSKPSSPAASALFEKLPKKRPPKQLSQQELDAMGFNPAFYTFGAFGLATVMVWVSAAVGVGIIQKTTGVQSLEEFSEYMRTTIRGRLPDLQSQLYRPPDDGDKSIPPVAGTLEPESNDDETEGRLSRAYDNGGIAAWAAQAFHELEREVATERKK